MSTNSFLARPRPIRLRLWIAPTVALITLAAIVAALQALQAHPHPDYVLSAPRVWVVAFVVGTPVAWLANQALRALMPVRSQRAGAVTATE